MNFVERMSPTRQQAVVILSVASVLFFTGFFFVMKGFYNSGIGMGFIVGGGILFAVGIRKFKRGTSQPIFVGYVVQNSNQVPSVPDISFPTYVSLEPVTDIVGESQHQEADVPLYDPPPKYEDVVRTKS